MVLENNDKILEALLKYVYRVAVNNRCKGVRLIKIPDATVKDIAHELDHPGLVRLFIKSQFHFMPIKFCQKHFNRDYPPSNVVFGGKCRERYKMYIERGIDDGS